MTRQFHIRLPATSANLGPAFDTAAVALNLHLEVTAEPADIFSISAEGRDAHACGHLEGNLVVDTYRQILSQENHTAPPLHLQVKNSIPLGMGCGSSAAARLAGIALAVRFGELPWRQDQILAVATRLEGHPDNASACWLGGMTASAVSPTVLLSRNLPQVSVARLDVPQHWRPILVLPREQVRTEESRRVLPDSYSRTDTVANLQHSALLVAAFASGDNRMLRAAMTDCLHQPYRIDICPLFKSLQPIRHVEGVLGVVLSGAGPGVLMIVDQSLKDVELLSRLNCTLSDHAGDTEVMCCEFESHGASSGGWA